VAAGGLDERIGRICGRWMATVDHRPGLVLSLAGALTVAAAIYAREFNAWRIKHFNSRSGRPRTFFWETATATRKATGRTTACSSASKLPRRY